MGNALSCSWCEDGVPSVLRAGPSDRHPCSQLCGGSPLLHRLPGGPPSACFHQRPCHVLRHPDSTHVPRGGSDRWEGIGFCMRESFPWFLLQRQRCLQGVQELCVRSLAGKITFLGGKNHIFIVLSFVVVKPMSPAVHRMNSNSSVSCWN